MLTLQNGLSSAIHKLQKAIYVTHEESELFIKTVKSSLLEADVDVKHILKIETALRQEYKKCDESRGSNFMTKAMKSRLVFELMLLLNPKGTKVEVKQADYNNTNNTNNSDGNKRTSSSSPAIVVMVGLNGNGKTTTVTKYARLQLKTKKYTRIGIIGADTHRAGAFDQLSQNAKKIGVPCYGPDHCVYLGSDRISSNLPMSGIATKCNFLVATETKRDHLQVSTGVTFEDTAVAVCRKGIDYFTHVSPMELILIDTSGRHGAETESLQQLRRIHDLLLLHVRISHATCHFSLVLDGSVGKIAGEQAAAFCGVVPIDSVILTKMDGSIKGGGAISAVVQSGAPITFLGTGEGPEAFESFDAQRYVQRLLGMGDLTRLFEIIQQQNSVSDIITGADNRFTSTGQNSNNNKNTKQISFRDLSQNLKTVASLGSMASLISYVPGLSNILTNIQEINQKKKQQQKHQDSKSKNKSLKTTKTVIEEFNPEHKIKTYLVIMNSMTALELDGDSDLFYNEPQRIERVSAGAGVAYSAVEELLGKLQNFQKGMGAIGNFRKV